jgi:hypothetical protein
VTSPNAVIRMTALAGARDGFVARRQRLDRVPFGAQDLVEQLARDLVVLDDQYLAHG